MITFETPYPSNICVCVKILIMIKMYADEHLICTWFLHIPPSMFVYVHARSVTWAKALFLDSKIRFEKCKKLWMNTFLIIVRSKDHQVIMSCIYLRMRGPSSCVRRVAIAQYRHAVAQHQTQTRAVWTEDGSRRCVEAHARVLAHLADIEQNYERKKERKKDR